jgi:hypothetical protein
MPVKIQLSILSVMERKRQTPTNSRAFFGFSALGVRLWLMQCAHPINKTATTMRLAPPTKAACRALSQQIVIVGGRRKGLNKSVAGVNKPHACQLAFLEQPLASPACHALGWLPGPQQQRGRHDGKFEIFGDRPTLFNGKKLKKRTKRTIYRPSK